MARAEVTALAESVETAERLLPVVVGAVARLAPAAGTILRQRHAARVSQRLAAMREEADALRRDPAAEIVPVIGKMESTLGRRLLVARIEWPKDPLGAPAVHEP